MKKFIKSIEVEATLMDSQTWQAWFRLGEDEIGLILFDVETKRMHVNAILQQETILLEDYGEFCFWANQYIENDDLREAFIEVAYDLYVEGTVAA